MVERPLGDLSARLGNLLSVHGCPACARARERGGHSCPECEESLDHREASSGAQKTNFRRLLELITEREAGSATSFECLAAAEEIRGTMAGMMADYQVHIDAGECSPTVHEMMECGVYLLNTIDGHLNDFMIRIESDDVAGARRALDATTEPVRDFRRLQAVSRDLNRTLVEYTEYQRKHPP